MERTEIERLSSSLFTSIVLALKEYGRALPVDYLAKIVGGRSSEIEEAVKKLSKEGIVNFKDREVYLIEK